VQWPGFPFYAPIRSWPMHNLRIMNGKTLCWSLLGTGVQTPSTRVLSVLRFSRPSPKQGYTIEVNRVPKRCEVTFFCLAPILAIPTFLPLAGSVLIVLKSIYSLLFGLQSSQCCHNTVNFVSNGPCFRPVYIRPWITCCNGKALWVHVPNIYVRNHHEKWGAEAKRGGMSCQGYANPFSRRMSYMLLMHMERLQ